MDYKNLSKNELLAEFDRLKKITDDLGFGAKKEFLYLPEILMDKESVIAISSGVFENRNGLVALTNSRIIFLHKGLLGGVTQSMVELTKISSINHKAGIMFGELIITTSSNVVKIESMGKESVKKFVILTQETMANNNQSEKDSIQLKDDLISRLERLAELRDRGILTDDEFLSEKAKLLK